jgi:hypothetical protein
MVADTVTSFPAYQSVMVESTISISGRSALMEIVAERVLLSSLLSTIRLLGSTKAVIEMACGLSDVGAVKENGLF